MTKPYTKEMQLKNNSKKEKVSTFGKSKNFIKKRSLKNRTKPNEKKYLNWLQEQDYSCLACDKKNGIEFHHVTDIKRIEGKRRSNNRLIPLCGVECHRLGKKAIHVMPKEEYYETIVSLEDMLTSAENIYSDFLRSEA